MKFAGESRAGNSWVNGRVKGHRERQMEPANFAEWNAS